MFTHSPADNLNPDPPGCECVRAQEEFDILQTIVTRSQLKDIIIISEPTKEGNNTFFYIMCMNNT